MRYHGVKRSPTVRRTNSRIATGSQARATHAREDPVDPLERSRQPLAPLFVRRTMPPRFEDRLPSRLRVVRHIVEQPIGPVAPGDRDRTEFDVQHR